MYNPLLLPDLRMMLQENDAPGLRAFCEIFHPAATAEVLDGLETADAWRVLSTCDLHRQAEIFEYLPLRQQVELVKIIDREHLSKLLEQMSADNRVDLLEDLDPDQVETILPLIAKAERAEIRKLLSYPEHSAGSIMTTEYASLPQDVTVREALDQLRRQAPNSETIYYIYVLDEQRHPLGFISLRDLILARPHARLADIMRKSVVSVRVDDDQELVAHELAHYDFIAIPVVDDQNRLVGIVTHDDVMDVLREEATEDAYRQAAVAPMEGRYLETPLGTMAWKRGIWLVLLLISAFFTFTVLHYYENVSAQYKWMVAFLPLVLASGGNAGSQSATLVIRALALGEIRREDRFRFLRVTWREFLTGMLLGGSIALLGFFFVWSVRSLDEAFVVGLTLALVVTLGTVNGAMLPILLKLLNADPALMSNPLIASLSDILGVVIYYNIALLLLGWATA